MNNLIILETKHVMSDEEIMYCFKKYILKTYPEITVFKKGKINVIVYITSVEELNGSIDEIISMRELNKIKN